MGKKVRSAMCTRNLEEGDDPYDVLPQWEDIPFILRATGQLERGEKSNILHWQVFLQFKDAIEISRLTFPLLKMHVDIKFFEREKLKTGKEPHAARGRNYVRKDTPYVNSRFDWPNNYSVFDEVRKRRKEEKEYYSLGKNLITGPIKDGYFPVDKEVLKKMLRMNISNCSAKLKVL